MDKANDKDTGEVKLSKSHPGRSVIRAETVEAPPATGEVVNENVTETSEPEVQMLGG